MKKHIIYQSQFKRALTGHLIGKQISFGIYLNDEKDTLKRGMCLWTIDGVEVELMVFGVACSIKTRRLYQAAVIRRVL